MPPRGKRGRAGSAAATRSAPVTRRKKRERDDLFTEGSKAQDATSKDTAVDTVERKAAAAASAPQAAAAAPASEAEPMPASQAAPVLPAAVPAVDAQPTPALEPPSEPAAKRKKQPEPAVQPAAVDHAGTAPQPCAEPAPQPAQPAEPPAAESQQEPVSSAAAQAEEQPQLQKKQQADPQQQQQSQKQEQPQEQQQPTLVTEPLAPELVTESKAAEPTAEPVQESKAASLPAAESQQAPAGRQLPNGSFPDRPASLPARTQPYADLPPLQRAMRPLGGGPAFLQLIRDKPGPAQSVAQQPEVQPPMTDSQRWKNKRNGRAPQQNKAALQQSAQQSALPAADAQKPAILFDLNGTLTSHTSVRHSTGITRLRPGLQQLHKLQEAFRLGIFSSASALTVGKAIRMIQQAAPAAEGQRQLFSAKPLIFHRTHTAAVQQEHVDGGGNEWDTVKPLAALQHKLGPLSRVLLVDDDLYKAVPGERQNMVLIPRWVDGDESDTVVEHLVTALLDVLPKDPYLDVRLHSTAIEQQVAQLSGIQASQARQPAAQDEEEEADDVEIYEAGSKASGKAPDVVGVAVASA